MSVPFAIIYPIAVRFNRTANNLTYNRGYGGGVEALAGLCNLIEVVMMLEIPIDQFCSILKDTCFTEATISESGGIVHMSYPVGDDKEKCVVISIARRNITAQLDHSAIVKLDRV